MVINVCSVSGVGHSAGKPVYTATKFAVHGLTLSWGQPSHYKRTGVKVVGICPGLTITPLLDNSRAFSLWHAEELIKVYDSLGITKQQYVNVTLNSI